MWFLIVHILQEASNQLNSPRGLALEIPITIIVSDYSRYFFFKKIKTFSVVDKIFSYTWKPFIINLIINNNNN